MAGAARLGDRVQGHGCFPETPIIEGSPDVSINGMPAGRVGDAVAPHGCPCPNSPHGMHARAIGEGAPTVFINGKPAARIGDAIGCGGVIVSGSGNVIIGNVPYRSPVHECVRQAVLARAPLVGLSPALKPLPAPEDASPFSR